MMKHASNQPADLWTPLHAAGGVAGDDPAIAPFVNASARGRAAADQATHAIAATLHAAGGVAGDDSSRQMEPDQPAYGTNAQNVAGGVAGPDGAVIPPDQPAETGAAP